jgi:peptidoglycan/LPS O-acetylase OafA/YrhL
VTVGTAGMLHVAPKHKRKRSHLVSLPAPVFAGAFSLSSFFTLLLVFCMASVLRLHQHPEESLSGYLCFLASLLLVGQAQSHHLNTNNGRNGVKKTKRRECVFPFKYPCCFSSAENDCSYRLISFRERLHRQIIVSH